MSSSISSGRNTNNSGESYSPGGEIQEFPARQGFSLSYKGKTLLSRIDPIAQAERVAENLKIQDRTLYFCPSPLYGYGLSLLLEKTKTSSSTILCVEVDEQLFDLSQRAMKSILDEGKDRLILNKVGTNPENALELCALVRKTWGERNFRKVEFLRLNGGWQLFPDLYEKAATILRQDMALAWSNAMTLIRLGRLYIRNAIRNLALIPKSPDISVLDYGADPVLVLGAGPSMDIILDELKGHFDTEKRPFRIICADTCMPSLKERDIQPDLALVLESQQVNLRAFLNSRGWKIPIAADLSSLPASTRVLGGKTYLFMTPWTELRLFDRLKQAFLLPSPLPPLGSVGLSAAELARRLSTGPIVTAGMDFSFTMDAYYARSSPLHRSYLSGGNRFKSLLNADVALREGTFATLSKSGIPVRSDPAMRNYRNLFENEFSSSKQFYEIKGPGLSLGVKEISPKEAVEILTENKNDLNISPSRISPKQSDKKISHKDLEKFVESEKQYLLGLRDILTGKISAEAEELENLLDTLDYLWAHFPECAAAGGRRPDAKDLSFLKRVRVEIDPFLKLWEEALILN